jgi:hypothetical protein
MKLKWPWVSRKRFEELKKKSDDFLMVANRMGDIEQFATSQLLVYAQMQVFACKLQLNKIDEDFNTWASGCSCASIGKPWECPECTKAYYDHMKKIVDSHRVPLSQIDPTKEKEADDVSKKMGFK